MRKSAQKCAVACQRRGVGDVLVPVTWCGVVLVACQWAWRRPTCLRHGGRWRAGTCLVLWQQHVGLVGSLATRPQLQASHVAHHRRGVERLLWSRRGEQHGNE